MIETPHQYDVTRTQLAGLERSLESARRECADLDPRLYRAVIGAIESQVRDLRDEMRQFEQGATLEALIAALAEVLREDLARCTGDRLVAARAVERALQQAAIEALTDTGLLWFQLTQCPPRLPREAAAEIVGVTADEAEELDRAVREKVLGPVLDAISHVPAG